MSPRACGGLHAEKQDVRVCGVWGEKRGGGFIKKSGQSALTSTVYSSPASAESPSAGEVTVRVGPVGSSASGASSDASRENASEQSAYDSSDTSATRTYI